MIKRCFLVLAVVLGAVTLYLLLYPVPIEPVAWSAPAAPGYSGPHVANTKLAGLKAIDLGNESGPEHVIVRRDGAGTKLYAAVASGKVLRMNLDGTQREEWLKTDGRILGMAFDAKGDLLLADAHEGLKRLDFDKSLTTLATSTTFQGRQDPIRFADAVVAAPDGKIYLSDASTRFGAKEWGGPFEASVLDILEQSATGRIIEFDPATNTSRVVAHGLSFANGLALSVDGQHLIVSETGKYRVWQIAIAAKELDLRKTPPPPRTQAKLLLDNLPGYPDNLMPAPPGADGTPRYWLGLAKPRSKAVDDMAGSPWLRKVTLRLPRALWPIPKPYGHVMQFDANGKITQDLQDPGGTYPETTGVTQFDGKLFIHSLHAKSLGWLPAPPSPSP